MSLPPSLHGLGLLLRASLYGYWRLSPGRILLTVLGIALGVAMGLAVDLIHRVAVDDFIQAARRFAGQADLVVRGDLPEAFYVALAQDSRVEAASPGVEVNLTLPGRSEGLQVMGLDPFRAQALGQPHAVREEAEPFAFLDPDALVLSEPAARWLGLKVGGALRARAGTRPVLLRVIGVLPGATRFGLMDIAGAQWHFGRLGSINRIDLRLEPGVDPAAYAAALVPKLPPGARVERPEAEGKRATEASRAYRVNLGVLATIALFTGVFLVFTTQWLSVLRRRPQLALLRTLGLTRGGLGALLLAEAAATSLLGSLLGAGLGILLAAAGLAALGGDLGAGYFPGLAPELRLSVVRVAGFVGLGLAASLAGAGLPAWEAARAAPARGIKPGDVETWLRGWQRPAPGLALVLAGALLPLAPPIGGIPAFAYLGIGLMILGAAALMPWLLARVGGRLPLPEAPPWRLALLRLRGAAGQSALAVAAIVVSVSLVTAMAVMVSSFRGSVADWLDQVLRADVYVRAGRSGGTGFLDAGAQAALVRLPGVARAEFLRFSELHLLPGQVPIMLMARPLDRASAPRILPMREAWLGEPTLPPAWVSESARDRLHLKPGQRLELPLGGRMQAFTVAGIWRDYAREHGAVAIDLALYRRLTGDKLANDAGLWVVAGSAPERVARAVRASLGRDLEVRLPAEVRRASLSAFDRSFAVTYALEAVAVAVGLFGVSAAFSAQALARRAEFGVLRHLGLSRRELMQMLAAEAALLALASSLVGYAAGFGASLVLIHVINPESFHWSMDLIQPWGQLALFYGALLVLAVATAMAGVHGSMGAAALMAVKTE